MKRPDPIAHRGRRARRRKTGTRRGIVIVLVLLMISITLALSYAVLRTQLTTLMIQNNSVRNNNARQDALSGLAIALQQMSQSSWGGVGSTLAGALSSTDSYQVTFTAGDPSLTVASSNYADFAYRVTLVSTGTSLDPLNSSIASTYQVQAVVRLNPRALGAPPANWSTMTQYTVYQYEMGQFSLDLPCQVSGPLWLQGPVSIGQNYNWSSTVLNQYLTDLKSMAPSTDYRPATGPMNLPYEFWNSLSLLSLLQSLLGVQTVDDSNLLNWLWNSNQSNTNMLLPSSSTIVYSLYPGGPVYTATALSSSLTNTTLVPDPIHNPLGIYYANSGLTIGSNVTIQGTLICNGQLAITGTSVALSPFLLSPLGGTTNSIRLPTVVATGSFICGSSAAATVTGTMLVGNQFTVDYGTQATVFNVTGHVLCGDFIVCYRNEWNVSASAWTAWYNSFKNQTKTNGQVAYPYFPNWLATVGHPPTPLIAFHLDTSAVTDQWQSLTVPIYIPATGDPGLFWNLMSWVENP